MLCEWTCAATTPDHTYASADWSRAGAHLIYQHNKLYQNQSLHEHRRSSSQIIVIALLIAYFYHRASGCRFFCPWSCVSRIWKSGSLSRAEKTRDRAGLFLVLLLCCKIHCMHAGENPFLPTLQKRFNQINNQDNLLWAMWNRLHICKVERHKRFSIILFYPHEMFRYSIWLDQTCPHFSPFEISAFTDN